MIKKLSKRQGNSQENQQVVNSIKQTQDLFRLSNDILSTKSWITINENEKNIVISAMSNVKFFNEALVDPQNLKDFINKCCELMTYEYAKKGTVLCHYGEPNSKLYIIIKGSVDVYIPRTRAEVRKEIEENKQMNNRERSNSLDSPGIFQSYHKSESQEFSDALNLTIAKQVDDIENDLKYQKVNDEYNSEFNHITLNNSLIMNQLDNQRDHDNNNNTNNNLIENTPIFPSNYYKDGVLKFKLSKTLGIGSYFGEDILYSNMRSSISTNIVTEDSYFLCLNPEKYNEINKDQLRKYEEKLKLFQKLLNGCSTEIISEFANAFKEKAYKYNQNIYSQGEICKELYLIKKGEVQLVTYEKNSTYKTVKYKEDDLKYFMCNASVLKQRKQPLKSNQQANKLVNLGPGNFFGEGNLFSKCSCQSTAKSLDSATILYTIPIDHCLNLFDKFPDLLETFKNKIQAKYAFHIQRLHNLSYIKDHLKEMNKHASGPSPLEKWPLISEEEKIINSKNQILSKRPSISQIMRKSASMSESNYVEDTENILNTSQAKNFKDTGSANEMNTKLDKDKSAYMDEEFIYKNKSSDIKNRSSTYLQVNDIMNSNKINPKEYKSNIDIGGIKESEDIFLGDCKHRFSFVEYRNNEKLNNKRLKEHQKKQYENMLNSIYASPIKIYYQAKGYDQQQMKFPSNIEEFYKPIKKHNKKLENIHQGKFHKKISEQFSKNSITNPRNHSKSMIDTESSHNNSNFYKSNNFKLSDSQFLHQELSSRTNLPITTLKNNSHLRIYNDESRIFTSNAQNSFPSQNETLQPKALPKQDIMPFLKTEVSIGISCINETMEPPTLPSLNLTLPFGNNTKASFKKMNHMTALKMTEKNLNNSFDAGIFLHVKNHKSETDNLIYENFSPNNTNFYQSNFKHLVKLPILSNNISMNSTTQSPIRSSMKEMNLRSNSPRKNDLNSKCMPKIFINRNCFAAEGKLIISVNGNDKSKIMPDKTLKYYKTDEDTRLYS